MRIKIISFMTPLYVVGFFVLTWAVWAHTTCPDSAEATVLEKARVDLKFKQPDDGAKEGAKFIRDHIIHVTDQAFDDFAGADTDDKTNKTLLGIDQ